MIHIEKRVHLAWLEFQQMELVYARMGMRLPRKIIGQYQYVVSNEKGQEISVVELPNYFRDGVTFWEIYCLDGDLFEDIERFGSFDEAMEAAKKYLKKK